MTILWCKDSWILVLFWILPYGHAGCPAGYEEHNNQCYIYYWTGANWTTARDLCQANHERLLIIKDSQLPDKLGRYELSLGSDFWVGAYRHQDDQLFYWLDGENVIADYWLSGEPNNMNGNEDCVQFLSATHKLAIGDLDCNTQRWFICEIKVVILDELCGLAFSGESAPCSATNAQCLSNGNGDNTCQCKSTHYKSGTDVCSQIVILVQTCLTASSGDLSIPCSATNAQCLSNGNGDNTCQCKSTHYKSGTDVCSQKLRECSNGLLPSDQCATSQFLKDLEQQLINGTVDASVALSVLRESIVDEAPTLNVTDLVKIQEILQGVVDHLDNSTPPIDDFLETASYILDNDQWQTRILNEGKGVEEFIGVVDQFVEIMSTTLEDHHNYSINIVTPNIVLQVKAIDDSRNGSGDNIKFPNTTLFDWNATSSTSLFLDYNSFKDQEVASIASILYRNISQILPATFNNREGNFTVNSQVISLSMYPQMPRVLYPNIELTFEVSEQMENIEKHCVFWKYENESETGTWSSKGCTLKSSNSSMVICQCDHLTNFALLINPYAQVDEPVSRIITYIGCGLSLIGLVLTVALHIVYWRSVRSDRNVLIVILCASLIAGNALFLGGTNGKTSLIVCKIFAVALHYTFLLVFFMMLAIGVYLLLSVMDIFHKGHKRRRALVLAAFILPLIVVSVSMGVTQLDGYGSSTACWLSNSSGLLWAFAGPAGFVILVNTVIIGIVMYKMCTTRSVKAKTLLKKSKMTLFAMSVLMPAMGISWAFGYLLMIENNMWMQIVFCIFNSFQGVFLFLTQCVLNKSLRAAIQLSMKRKQFVEDFQSAKKKRKGPTAEDKTISVHTNIDARETQEKNCETMESDSQAESSSVIETDNFRVKFNKVRDVLEKELKQRLNVKLNSIEK